MRQEDRINLLLKYLQSLLTMDNYGINVRSTILSVMKEIEKELLV